MVFKCQEDSFLKEFKSKVLSCEPSPVKFTVNSKKSTIDGYKVIMEDTILFPEGGGQPSDTGYINDSKVYHVARKEDIAIHYVDKPLTVGEEVHQTVDWDRREDHMQQHSGQHLISAIFEKEHGIITTSWWLGQESSYVDLEGSDIVEKVEKVEERVNALVREDRQVSVILQSENVPLEADERHSRGLPADHKGDVRIINIEGIDKNKCCGTHVTSLSQLQIIKFLEITPSKQNRRRLHFLCGHRVLKKFEECLKRDKELTKTFRSDNYLEQIYKKQKQYTADLKDLNKLLSEIAQNIVQELKDAQPSPKYFIYHRPEATPDFVDCIIRGIGSTEIFLYITTGNGTDDSAYLMAYGPQEAVDTLGPKLNEFLDGKGFARKHKYTAKIKDISKTIEAEKIVKDYFELTELN